MWRLAIVDDEAGVRRGLAALLDWEALGFEAVGEAGDGETALALIAELEPDLLLLDIRMPGTDGISVLKALEGRAKRPRVLVLTGHSDFSYAQSALNLGARGYLLKPVDEDELEAKVREVAGELEEERKLGRIVGKAKTGERAANLARLLSGALAPKAAAEAFPEGDFDAEFQVALISRELARGIGDAGRLEETAGDFFSLLNRETVPLERYLAILFRNENRDTLRRYLEQFHRRIAWLESRQGEGSRVTGAIAALGPRGRGPEGLLESCASAERLAETLFYREDAPFVEAEGTGGDAGGAVAEVAETAAPADVAKPPRAAGPIQAPDAADVIPFIEILDLTRIDRAFEALEAALRSAALPPGDSRNRCIALAMEIRATLMAKHPEKELCANPVTDLVNVIMESRYLAEAVSAVRLYARGVAGEFGEAAPGNHILKVIQYVRNNYAGDLKLESLGETFNCNSAYLGKRFKEQTGESFNSYLDRIRIDAAKELLKTTDMKVYQVSKLVGYPNIDYFFAKFRRHVGMTPRAYKTGGKETGGEE